MPSLVTLTPTREQVLAFRLASHNLAARLPLDDLLLAAGACGVQNTPPGAAAVSLHARLANLTLAGMDFHLREDKRLLQMWSLRGAPHLFPTAVAAVFTLGLLPPDEESLRGFVPGIAQGLAIAGMTATGVVKHTAAAVRGVLDGRVVLGKQQLDRELAAFVEERISAEEAALWRSPSPYAPDQTLGEALVSFALRPVALQGLVCFVPGNGRQPSFARTEQWLGYRLPPSVREGAAGDLVRRYLHCYGPSTVQDFAAWTGMGDGQARAAWGWLTHELAPVGFGGRETWMLRSDVERLLSAPAPRGMRFLPAHDPYLQARDRSLLVSSREWQHLIWRASGSPGVLLVDGEIAGTWRSQVRGSALKLQVEFLGPSYQNDERLAAEAEGLARFNGCQAVDLAFAH